MKIRFRDRYEAGQILAKKLHSYARPDSTVVGLGRGGVPIAFEIAQRLNVPLDVFIVREITKPGEPETPIGAVASGGVLLLEEEAAAIIESRLLQDAIEREDRELEAQEEAYRGRDHVKKITDRTVLLVDDGLTTPQCIGAAVEALYRYRPSSVVVAAPVISKKAASETTRQGVNKVIAAAGAVRSEDVREFYDDLSPLRDEEVVALLHEHSASMH